MILGKFGTNPNLENLQTRHVDCALIWNLGVECGNEIIDTPSMDSHEHVGTLGIHPG